MLDGQSAQKTGDELDIASGSVTGIWRKCRNIIAWHELDRPALRDKDCVLDTAWGAHRRVAHHGAPSRPRVLEAKPFQVNIAFLVAADGTKRFAPGSLTVQAVASKQAAYTCRISQTVADASRRMLTDQGGEWSRMPRVFARVRTVNHSLEWCAADGTTTNLGECHNGIAKSLGSQLGLFPRQTV